MDPKACLGRMEQAVKVGDHDEARAAHEDYQEWRRKGGFEPEGGDLRAQNLMVAVSLISEPT